MFGKQINASELKGKIDFGIITIRVDESEAVLQRFPHETIIKGRQIYALSSFTTTNDDDYLIASVRCAEQGNLHAQQVANNLIEELNPQWILVVGIAGTVPKNEHTLGDVVLATRVSDFCVSASLEGGEEEFDIRGGAMHPAVQKLVAALPMIKPFLEEWTTPEKINFPRPKVTASASNFYGDDKWKKKVKENIAKYFGKHSVRNTPKAFTGTVASSDRLVKDTELIKDWTKSSRQVSGIEMELAGVYQAAADSHTPVLAIRGISDIVGFKRSDDWTEYACHTAAAFTYSLLRYRPIIPISVKGESDDSDKPDTSAQYPKITHPVGVFKEPPPNLAPIAKKETLYSNLLEVSYFPESLYSVRTDCSKRTEVWTLLNKTVKEPPNDWIVKGRTLYAFHDFSEPHWKDFCDMGTVEEHGIGDWSNSTNRSRIAEFIELLKNALRQLCLTRELYYKYRSPFKFFYYAPTEDLTPRTVSTKSLIRTGSHTVFKGYYPNKEDKFRYYRHSAFRGEFERFEDKWFLEITPTYHYTNDGHKVFPFYKDELSGIKREENNEAVFRQVLFWAEVLKVDKSHFLAQEKYPFLEFGDLLHGTFPYGVFDEVWKAKESASKKKFIEQSESLFT